LFPHPHHGTTVPVLPPALSRRLDQAARVKQWGRNIAAGLATITVIGALSAGIPAYAHSVLEAEEQTEQAQLQSFAVTAEAARPPAIERDGYTVVVPPPLQYPLLTGTGITSGFGMRGGKMHNGADIFPGYGTPVHAMAAGVVKSASGGGDYGNRVILVHHIDGQEVVSLYAHLAPGSMTVSAGDTVTVGQVIGAVGATGNAQGAHLHFEIYPGGGGPVNPYPWIAARL